MAPRQAGWAEYYYYYYYYFSVAILAQGHALLWSIIFLSGLPLLPVVTSDVEVARFRERLRDANGRLFANPVCLSRLCDAGYTAQKFRS